MSNVGVFQWIREGVRRAVLLGFSDAVEQLGVPADNGELHPQLAAVLRRGRAAPVTGWRGVGSLFGEPWLRQAGAQTSGPLARATPRGSAEERRIVIAGSDLQNLRGRGSRQAFPASDKRYLLGRDNAPLQRGQRTR
jgi:hypothetical protein